LKQSNLGGTLAVAIRELSCHNRENHTGISWTRATKEELHSNIWQKKCSTVGAHRTLILIVFVGKKGGNYNVEA
jgi:hypothetical protein